MKKPKDKRRTRDLYYRRKYGITLAEYETMLAESKGGCWICGYVPPPDKKSLAVDHDHAVARTKIVVKKRVFDASEGVKVKRWTATAAAFPVLRCDSTRSGVEARKALRMAILALSCRGLCCWKCNSGLKKFRDNADYLNNASLYLRAFQNKLAAEK